MKLRRILSLILACSLAVTMFTVIPAAAADTVITQDNPSGTLTITLKIKGTASVTTAPTAKEGLTTSNGAAVELLENPGTAEGGTMAYSLNGTDYSADIPSADAAGTYTVYYKAIGDEDHNDSEAQTLTVTVGASGALTITLTITPDDVVSNQINALPAKDDVTLDDKADIEAARAAYDALTDDQKAKVDAETLKKLTDAETALAAAEKDAADTAAANTVSETINALPDADKVTTADKDAIEAARKAYDDLTDDQKAKVDAETLKKLTDAETALAAAEKDAADTAAANTVSETINALPDADKVTTADKNAIEAARKAYDDLTDDQKKKVSDDTLKKLTDAEDALKAAGVSDTINALPAADEVTTANKDAIEAARAAYDALTNAQKGYVSADTLKNLTDAEDALAAAGASDTINALPAASNVTTADKDDIEAARAAYDALTNAQKGYVSADTLKKLTDAEDALAAAGVSDTINALPAASDVTTADKDAIEAARKAYNDLTDDQKGYVSADTLKKLTDAEEALEVAETVAKINALPASDNVKTTDKADIEAARKAYDDLTDDQKAKVSEDTLKKLTDAESALEVAETVAKINALPAADDVKTTDKTDIEAARTAYDALTADQKAKVSENTLKKLTDAESTLAVAEVNEAINALPDADNVTVSDKDAIEAARKAYNDLTDDQKAKVSEDTLKKLTDAESAFTVASVSEKINALPDADKVTTADKEAIEEARGFYDALTDAQKTKVSEDTLKKLTDAEAALKDAVDTAAANTASESINALPDADKVTTADKNAIEAARKAYDDLTDDQKAKVDAETLKKLTDAETALAAAEKDAADTAAANTVSETINALPDADKVTTADKDAIEAARKAYDDLTDDQKAKVDAETLKKLTDAETALAAAEKKAAEEKAAKELAAAKKNAQKAMNAQVVVTQKGKKITVKWNKSTAADGYMVYVQYCGKKIKKAVKTIKNNKTTKLTLKKLNGKKLNLKKQFRVYVKPYKIVNGKKKTLAKSIVGHIVGVKNKKFTNVKSIKVNKKAVAIQAGKAFKIKAKVKLVDKTKKHISKSHAAKFRYRTSDKNIATVTKSGKIKGINKGTCTVYVYAINGKMKKVKVTVK